LEQLLSNSTTSFDTCIRFFFCCHTSNDRVSATLCSMRNRVIRVI
jgi:hypothetical protein